jgi:hypothetical protein
MEGKAEGGYMKIKYTVDSRGGFYDITAEFYDEYGKLMFDKPLGDSMSDKLNFIRDLAAGIAELTKVIEEE